MIYLLKSHGLENLMLKKTLKINQRRNVQFHYFEICKPSYNNGNKIPKIHEHKEPGEQNYPSDTN